MKLCRMVGLLLVCAGNICAMETGYTAIPMQEKTLGTVAQSLDKAYRKRDGCHCSPSSHGKAEKRVADCEKDYAGLLQRTQNSSLEWPAEVSGFTLAHVEHKNKNIETVCSIENGVVRTVFDTMPYQPYGITSIDFSHNSLQEFPLLKITKVLTNLAKCDVSHNNIEYVSLYDKSNVYTHKQLQSIDISHNALESFDMGCLVSTYPNCSSINCASNPLQSIGVDNLGNHNTPQELFIDCRNTQLSPEEQEKLSVACIGRAQISIWGQIAGIALLSSMGTSMGSAVVLGWILELSAPVGLGGTLGSGGLVAALSGFIGYKRQHHALKEIEQQVRSRIIFEDSDASAEELS